MSFHSATFALFFALVVVAYYSVPQARSVPVLLAASVLFYVGFVWQYVFVILALIVVNYTAGLRIEGASTDRGRRRWLLVALAVNLGVMGAFKYSFDLTGGSLGVMPVGLSFHTFQAIAYIVEVYRGRQPAERSFSVYALYIMFFPQIAAGPIERPGDMLPQFRKPHPFRYADAVAGLQLMAWGMFQKYIVADRLAAVVNSIYDSPVRLSGPVTAFGAVCFSFQMFCDFAGYSEIALGAAQVLGLRLTRNFNNPFHADSMAEYWKRWHISLSTWMRDYVFFPLCGKRPRMPRICGSIMVVFLANALWHGARWNYVVEGLLHGSYRVVELTGGRAISRAGWSVPDRWGRPLQIARTVLVFCLMTFAFLFFRGANLSQSVHVAGRLLSGWGTLASPHAMAAAFAASGVSWFVLAEAPLLILLVEAVQVLRSSGPLRPRIAALPVWYRWAFYYAAATVVLFLVPETGPSFIYFGF